MRKELRSIYFTEEAMNDLSQIISAISEFTGYASSGIRFWEDLENSIHNLAMFPLLGVTGILPNTRELYHNDYRVVYEIADKQIIIKTVIHCSKLYPT